MQLDEIVRLVALIATPSVLVLLGGACLAIVRARWRRRGGRIPSLDA